MTNNQSHAHPDLRDASFSTRALAELQLKQKSAKYSHRKGFNKHKLNYWVIVELPSGKRKEYQLSKDLQHAIHHDGQKDSIHYLINSLIVIPLTDFYIHKQPNPHKKEEPYRYADMTIGKILFVIKKPHTSNSRWITRGQFSQPTYNSFAKPNYRELANYLKHDYDPISQQRIIRAIPKLVKPRYKLDFKSDIQDLNKVLATIFMSLVGVLNISTIALSVNSKSVQSSIANGTLIMSILDCLLTVIYTITMNKYTKYLNGDNFLN